MTIGRLERWIQAMPPQVETISTLKNKRGRTTQQNSMMENYTTNFDLNVEAL